MDGARRVGHGAQDEWRTAHLVWVLTGVVALLTSHWAALVLTGLGAGLPLLTLQPADRPWETWIVLPAAWALTLWAARQLTSPDPVDEATTTGRHVRDRP